MALLSPALAASEDDFNDNAKDILKWGPDLVFGQGVIIETNQRLEYACGEPGQNSVDIPWVLTRFPYNADWSVQIDAFNSTAADPLCVNSLGLWVVTDSPDNGLFIELFSSALRPGLPYRTGFHTVFESISDAFTADTHAGDGVTNAAFRIAFNGSAKVFTVFTDTNVADGYQWEEQSSFGIANSGGANGNTDWKLGDADQFAVLIYGFSNMAVTNGQMYMDNFAESGGVAPATSIPTGKFHFQFPTNNPQVTPIVSVAGDYSGMAPGAFPRNYNLNTAQDKTGRLTMMGTIDGVLDNSGDTNLMAAIGMIKTINGKPTALLKSKFTGTLDGLPFTFSGTAILPVEIVDLGGGTNGLSGTGSFKSKLAGISTSKKNVAIQIPLLLEAQSNIRKDWTLELTIGRIALQGKERVMASARLTLPTGEIIAYPAKTTQYSPTKGYSFSFKGGTNISANPQTPDKKSSVMIKGLKLVQQGIYWQPVSGAISYQFLGQRGTADLMDFIEP